MAYRHMDNQIGFQPITATETTQKHALGTKARAVDAFP